MMDVHISDDYACLTVGGAYFYYGWEEQYCPEHTRFNHPDCEDCDTEWSFKAVFNGTTYCYKNEFIGCSEGDDVEVCLLKGIGKMIELSRWK